MKKIGLALLVAGLMGSPAIASANEPYVSVSAGLGMMHDSDLSLASGYVWDTGYTGADAKYDTGYALEAALGMKMDKFRAELALGYQSSEMNEYSGRDVNNVDASVFSVMANGYADFEMEGFSPYVMAGLGYANIDISTGYYGSSISTDESAFAWQVGVGVGVQATDEVIVDFGYRYFQTSDVDFAYITSSVASSKLMVGMRYAF